MLVRCCRVGDVIRKLREERGPTAMSLTQKVRVPRSMVVSLERQGPEIEDITPSQWCALDLIAAVVGLKNRASPYKYVLETVGLNQRYESRHR